MDEEQTGVIDQDFAEPEHQEQYEAEQTQEISDKEKNFAALREKQEQIAKENAELRQRLEYQQMQYQEALNRLSTPQQPQRSQWEVDRDDYLSGEHLMQYEQQRLPDQIDQRVKEYMRQQENSNWEHMMRSQYVDFDQVINTSSVQEFAKQEPEIFQLINQSGKTNFQQAQDLYKLMKKRSNSGKYAQKMEENQRKPRGMAQANARTPLQSIATNDRNWSPAEMEAFRAEMS